MFETAITVKKAPLSYEKLKGHFHKFAWLFAEAIQEYSEGFFLIEKSPDSKDVSLTNFEFRAFDSAIITAKFSMILSADSEYKAKITFSRKNEEEEKEKTVFGTCYITEDSSIEGTTKDLVLNSAWEVRNNREIVNFERYFLLPLKPKVFEMCEAYIKRFFAK